MIQILIISILYGPYYFLKANYLLYYHKWGKKKAQPEGGAFIYSSKINFPVYQLKRKGHVWHQLHEVQTGYHLLDPFSLLYQLSER